MSSYSHCPGCGEQLFGGYTHVCHPALKAIPLGWKQCPHCLGSGVVQADDMRYSEPLLRAGPDTPEDA